MKTQRKIKAKLLHTDAEMDYLTRDCEAKVSLKVKTLNESSQYKCKYKHILFKHMLH